MMKLFRKIRQELIVQGKLKKFLYYAFGEIIIVVIGILIALQINSWHQINSENSSEKDYIVNMLVELNSNLDYFKNLKKNNTGQIDQINEIIVALNTKHTNNLDEEKLIANLMASMRPFPFFPKIATYSDLVTSGKMELMRPMNLRQKIITHYNLLESTSLHIEKELNYNWTQIHPFFNNHGYFEWRNNPAVAFDTTVIPKIRHFSILDLEKTSNEYKAVENNILFNKAMLTVRNQNLDELLQSSEDLIAELTSKLDNL